MSATPDSTLANPEQRIADLERQLAECKAERDEALKQQTATAEVLRVINSSPGELAPVFEAVLQRAVRICDASFGTLYLRETDAFRAVAMHNAPPAFAEARTRALLQPPPDAPLGRVAITKQVAHIADIRTHRAYVERHPFAVAAAELGNFRTVLSVPMLRDDELIGAITIYRQEVRPFTDKQIELVRTFADQAVIAIENARLLTETREALGQQTATAEVLQVINSSPGDLIPVFDAILEKAHTLCEAAHGALVVYDGEHFRAVALRAMPEPFGELLREPFRASEGGTAQQRLLRGEGLIHIPDVTVIEPTNPIQRASIDAGIRTLLVVALRKDDGLLGYITAHRREVRPFTDKQIALLQNFAAQAVIAMENARLLTETREALEQQTATAEILQVINSSPGDLAPVFDAMLEKALHLCEADLGGLYRFDGNAVHPLAARSGSKAAAEILQQSFVIEPGSSVERLVRGEDEAVQVRDIVDTEAYRSGAAYRVKFVELTGARTSLWVALRKDKTLVGVFVVYREEVRPFSDKQTALLQNFAAQAVIAMENARLITETREALEQQTATAEVLQVINSSPGDLTPVFDAILGKAHALCGAPLGSLVLSDGEQLRAVATRGYPDEYEALVRAGFAPTEVFKRLLSGERFFQNADSWESGPDDEHPMKHAAREIAGVRTLLAVPLHKEGALLGYISAQRQVVSPFNEKQIALLENFASQAVIAMENARLLTETREALEQQTATAEVLQVINSSPGDLDPVFDAMLEKATGLCEARAGVLRSWDGECFHVSAVHGEPRFSDWVRQRGPTRPGDHDPLARITKGAGVVHFADPSDDPGYATSPDFRKAVELSGMRSGVTVPLRKDDALVGAITVFRQEVRPFTDKQTALLQNFAAQAVIAMENARLLTETREALEQQTATAEVLQVINSSPGDLAPVFNAMLAKALRLCQGAHGLLYTYDGDSFHQAAIEAEARVVDWWRQYGPVQPKNSDSPLGRLIAGERIIRIVDARKDRGYITNPGFREMVDKSGIRSGVTIALDKEGSLRGAITIYRKEPHPFSDRQIALLQNFAEQAVIAMENARLLTETREALEQQTATAEVLQVINSSPGELAPVFGAILEKAHTLCGAVGGGLVVVEGDQVRAVAVHGEPRFAEYWMQQGCMPHWTGAPAPLARGEPVHIPDMTLGDNRQSDQYNRLVELSGARTLLIVPLRKDNLLLGAITAFREEVSPFSDKQIALLQNFAAQAVIAMENARLLTETRESLEQQTATAEVLQVINSSPGDLMPVFDAILEKAHNLCGAEYGALQLYDGEMFRAVATRGTPESVATLLREPHPPGPNTTRLLAGDRFYQSADMAENVTRGLSSGPINVAAAKSGTRSLLLVPLRKDKSLIGVISASRFEVKPFSEKQIALLENFAAQAVIAMENARLLGELRQSTEEVAELNRGLEVRVAEQVEELGRVGRLKRFLAPQLAELIVSQGDEKILESHRREIVVVFCDLRGYTAFTETAEPEEVLDFLREYHGALGPLVGQFEGTLDQFSGDGIMVFFNDPVPCPDPAERAVMMAMAMREAAGKLIADWRRHSHELGFGAGIAQGYATLGQIGFSERSGYTAIGTVCNLAARLCAEAKDGHILVSSRIAGAVEAVAKLEDLGNLELKGLRRPVAAFNVVQSTSPGEARPNLTIVARGPGV